MITLKTLKWSNVFSYGPDNELILNANTLTQIVGLNGSGKSSIPLIIEEILYNKNSAGKKKAKIPNRYIGDGYFMYLSFDKDQDEYEVTVDRKGSIKVKLEKNGEDISSHTATNTYKTIQEILGLDFKTFSQLVYQSTDASLQFLTATDTNRKKFLIDLLHLELYVKLFDLFKDAAKEVNAEASNIQAKLDTIEKWLADNKLTDTTILPMLTLEINTEEEEKEFRQLTIEIENISEKNKKISRNNQYKSMLEKVDLPKAQAIKVTEKCSYDALQAELGEYLSTKNTQTKLLTKLRNLGDSCPTCEQAIPTDFKANLIKAAEHDIETAEEKSVRTTEHINRIKQENDLYDLKIRVQKEWEDIYRSIDKTLPSDTMDGQELTERLGRVRTSLLRAKESVAEAARLNETRTKHNTRIQVIQEQTEAFLKELKKHSDILSKRSSLLSNLEILKKAFSTNGLLAYKIENMVKDLEDLTNRYLSELSDGRFTIQFVVANDKLNVEITDDGYVIDIEEVSTGEVGKINTATLIAIRKLMSSISKSKLNVLFLDEVISVLDDAGKEKLVEVLLAEEDLNTYLVSHGWSHPLVDKIEVHKIDKISHLET